MLQLPHVDGHIDNQRAADSGRVPDLLVVARAGLGAAAWQAELSKAEIRVKTATMVGQVPNPGCWRIWMFWSSVMGQILSRSISRRSACSTQTSRTGCTGHSGMPVAPLALSGPVSSLQEAWCLNGHLSYRCQRAHETGLNNRFAVLSCSA